MRKRNQAKQPNLLDYGTLNTAAEMLKLMGHPVRLRIVDILTQGAYPVNEIAALCETAPHQVSEHLRLMQHHGLLSSRREGRTVYYEIQSVRLPLRLDCIKKHCNL